MIYKNLKNTAQQFLGNYKQENPATFAAAQQAIGWLLILDGFIGIDNPLGGKKRSGIFGSLIGVALGVAVIVGTGFMGNLFGINSMTATTTAMVVSVSQPTNTSTAGNNSSSSGGACNVQAKYTIEGREYTQTASGGSSSACSLTQGQTIDINYDPNSPGAFAYDLNTAKTILRIFPIVGAIAVVISLVTFAIRFLSIIFGWRLLKSGRSLAKTLPAGTDLSTIMNEIKQNFAKTVFGIGGNSYAPAQPAQMQASPPPQSPAPPSTI